MGQPAYRKALLLCLAAATEATKVSERKWKAAADEALAAFKPIRKSVNSCVENQNFMAFGDAGPSPLDRARTAIAKK